MPRIITALMLIAATTAVHTVADDSSPAAMMARIEGAQSPNRQGLDPLTLQQLMERFHVPGVGVAVIRDFEIHWAKGYGVADIESGAQVDADALFQAASISKPVTAMAALRAVQDGRFSLDADINTILKSWKLPAGEFTRRQAVTPRALMSHTSGLGDGFGFPGYHPSAARPTIVEILNGSKPSNVGPVLMEREPFTAAKYSGGGVTLMQLALMDALGKPFPEIMQSLVLGPIGMTHSANSRCRPSAIAMRRARTMAAAVRWIRSGTSIPSWPRPVCGRHRPIWRSSPSKYKKLRSAARPACSISPWSARC
jgi:CubicO group peptidase (beta-lactamase class C family)